VCARVRDREKERLCDFALGVHMYGTTVPHSSPVCVCVCVCERQENRERERTTERKREKEREMKISCVPLPFVSICMAPRFHTRHLSVCVRENSCVCVCV